MKLRRPFLACWALAVLADLTSIAQETPTEREAARGILQKLDALERSLDVPALVARLTGPNPERDRVVARAKELMDKELLALSDDITRNPEIGFVERRSIGKLIAYLKAHDFDVQVGVPGLETAFVARFAGSNGPPNLGVIVEYDALRGTERPFHGDQHSAQGPVGLAAAVAMAEFLARTKTPGSVTVFGCPGEEMMPPNAKTVMFQAGVYAGVDVLVRSHASGQTTRPAPGRPQGYEETGSVSSAIPGIGFSAHSSNAPGHTYEMEADALAEVGHHGFVVDAQAMTALLYDFGTRADYRVAVKREFDAIKTLFAEYLAALEKTYSVPSVPDPK